MASESAGRTVVSVPDIRVPSVCPYCSCGCGLYLHYDSAHTTGSSPRLNHPVSRGRLCSRGWAAHEPGSWAPRLLLPALRSSNGQRPTSWSNALDTAADELRALLDGGKPVGVIVSGRSTNEECYLSVKLARGALRSGNIDAPLRAYYEALLGGWDPLATGARQADPGPAESGRAGIERVGLRAAGSGQARSGPAEIFDVLEGARRILLLEGDLASTHPRVASAVLRALRAGARVVTLGLTRTQMSEVAACHFPLDVLAPAILPHGLAEALDLGEGDPTEADDGSLAVVLSPFSADAGALGKACRALRALLDRNGESPLFLPLPLRANGRGAFEMGASPGHWPGALPLENSAVFERIRREWGVDPRTDPGASAEAMLERVDGLVIIRDHPTAWMRKPDRANATLQRLQSLIVLDAYRSPTSDMATVALPLADLSETEGTLTSAEGRLQRLRAGVSPPGEGRQGWAVLSALLQRLGLDVEYASFDSVFSEIRRVIPEYGRLPGDALDSLDGSLLGLPTAAAHPDQESRVEGTHEDRDVSIRGRYRLALDGAFEWGDDLLVDLSPTLRREASARRKLYPGGLVTMNPSDGRRLATRSGSALRLRSSQGETIVPVVLSPRVQEGDLIVPFGFRHAVAPVLGERLADCVEVERA